MRYNLMCALFSLYTCAARFRVEDTSPRAVCRLAMLPERLCGSDGRYHTTSSKASTVHVTLSFCLGC